MIDGITVMLFLSVIIVFAWLYWEQGKLHRELDKSRIDLVKLKRGLQDDWDKYRQESQRIKDVSDAIDFMSERNKRKGVED